MSTSTRVFVAIACITVLVLGGAVGMACASVYRSGTVAVHLSGGGAPGNNLSLKVPGFLLPLAVRFVPDATLREVTEEVRPFLPALRAGLDELSRCEDALFVHVVSRGEEVEIGKKDGALYVHLVSDGGTVHVSLPLHAVAPILARIEAVRPVG